MRLRASPVKEAALARGLLVYEPLRLRDFAREIAPLGIDAFVVASYGRIVPAELLAVPTVGALNVHPSLLPRYRGATPIHAALLAGDKETGVTIMLMDEGMDTGDVVLQERVAIVDGDDFVALHERLAQRAAALLMKALALGEREGGFPHHRQSGEPVVTRPIAKADLSIDWNWNAERIVNHVRAYSPQPAARTTLRGVPVKILKARVAASGERSALLVPCGDGAVAVDELVAPNRGRESGAEFARRVRVP